MARYHVNPSTGNAGLCRAHRACPFGGEEVHFDSREAAAAAYEKRMDKHQWPAAHEQGQKELSKLAKTSSKLQDLKKVLADGSPHSIAQLGHNPAASSAMLAKAARKVSSQAHRRLLLAHPRFPVKAMTPEEFSQAISKATWTRRGELLSDDGLTDAHLTAALSKDGAINYYDAMANENNKLSEAKIVALSETNWMSLERGIQSGRYPLERRVDHIELSLLRSTVRRLEEPETLNIIARRAVAEDDESTKWQLASNRHTPSEALSAIVASSEATDTLVAAYRNPATPPLASIAAVEKSSVVESYARLENMDGEYDGGLAFEIGPGEEDGGGFGSQTKTIQFDRKRVRELGLSKQDIDTYVRYYRGNYLFNASYSPATGVYSGSSD